MLKLIALSSTLPQIETLALPVCEDGDIHDNPEIQHLISKATALKEFCGEKNQRLTLYDLMDTRVRRCLFLGVGHRQDLTAETLRAFAGRAVKAAMDSKQEQLVMAAPLANPLTMEPLAMVSALLEGAYLGNHAFQKYKEKPKDSPLKQISLLVPPTLVRRYASRIGQIEAVCRGALMAREWVSMPSNEKPPPELAQMFAQAGQKAKINVQVIDETQLRQQNFNALLAVAAGSAHPPCLVEMEYHPVKARKTIVLVGKGVTFDTGGINLKPSQGLETMKADMAGAAAVAAAMMAIAELKPKLRVVGITPLVENMPSGKATRPGDIVTSYSGKTVEIENTDAEGRLILIDAMAYAIQKYQPDLVIDVATLTGACVVALGEKIAGLFCQDNALAEAISASGETVFERCWRMPMPDDYKELFKSELADVSNMSSSRYGGAITAALFLAEFVGETPWAHIDIAGPAYFKKGSDYCGPGGTGFGVRLLCHLIQKMDNE